MPDKKKPYGKPTLKTCGLLRQVTKYSGYGFGAGSWTDLSRDERDGQPIVTGPYNAY
jgi:hypothetical protein